MSYGKVNVVQVNTLSGGFAEAERIFLFIGPADGTITPDGSILSLNPQSDLDTLLGPNASELKTALAAFFANAVSENARAYAVVIDLDGGSAEGDDWRDVVDAALAAPNDLNIEGVVVTHPITTADEIEDAQTHALLMQTTYGKFVTVHMAVAGINPATQTWAQYRTAIKAIVNGVAASRVAVVPALHGNNLGVVIGRLCNPGVTIADSPMRVATGAVVGLGALPVDSAGLSLTLADVFDLADARFSVPQWYSGYDGVYWADHAMLDVEGGDFQVFENLRVLDYLARRVRILAIAKIADRSLNNSDASISKHKQYFARPLRDAAHSITIGSREIPGLIRPPASDAVTITWTGQTEVAIAITAQPYESPKKITVYLALDLA